MTIKERMERAGKSPVDVAYHCKVSFTTVYNWINKNKIIKAEHERLFNELVGNK